MNGYSMVILWLLYGYSMVILWLLYGYFMVIIWLLYGYYMLILWLLYGYYMVIIWLMMVNNHHQRESKGITKCQSRTFVTGWPFDSPVQLRLPLASKSGQVKD